MIERNVHHQGKVPSRTCLATPVFSKVAGAWSTVFETWRGIPDSEFRVSSITTGALFETSDAAYAAGDRALDMLQETGKFPNMCEAF